MFSWLFGKYYYEVETPMKTIKKRICKGRKKRGGY